MFLHDSRDVGWPLQFHHIEGAEDRIRGTSRLIRHKDGVPTSNLLGSSPYVKLVHSSSELDVVGVRMGRQIEHNLTGNLISVAEDKRRSAPTHRLIDLIDLRSKLRPPSEAPGHIEFVRKRQADRGKCVRKVTNGADEESGQQSADEKGATARPSPDRVTLGPLPPSSALQSQREGRPRVE